MRVPPSTMTVSVMEIPGITVSASSDSLSNEGFSSAQIVLSCSERVSSLSTSSAQATSAISPATGRHGWVDDVLATAQNPSLKTVNLLASVEAKEEETVEGMQEEAHDHDEHDHDEIEYDEHVWLSLRNAETLTQTIANTLCELDFANAPAYQENAASYIAQLKELDNQYKDAVNNGQHMTILFADRFPFRYLADDYGLTYFAAFAGCSAETEASFETIAFLARKVDELQLPVVLTIEGANHAIAETVVSSTQAKNQAILTMNSMQSVTAKDAENGESYLGIMAENLNVLKEALN